MLCFWDWLSFFLFPAKCRLPIRSAKSRAQKLCVLDLTASSKTLLTWKLARLQDEARVVVGVAAADAEQGPGAAVHRQEAKTSPLAHAVERLPGEIKQGDKNLKLHISQLHLKVYEQNFCFFNWLKSTVYMILSLGVSCGSMKYDVQFRKSPLVCSVSALIRCPTEAWVLSSRSRPKLFLLLEIWRSIV